MSQNEEDEALLRLEIKRNGDEEPYVSRTCHEIARDLYRRLKMRDTEALALYRQVSACGAQVRELRAALEHAHADLRERFGWTPQSAAGKQ